MHGLIIRGTGLNRIRPAFLIVAWGLMAFAPGDSLAQQPVGNDWIGKRVVPKYQDFKLKIENQVIDPKWIATYRVEHVNGPWLWLYATQLHGWALADQVVPVEQAIEFFTDYIRSNPGDAHGYIRRAIIWRQERKEFDIALGDCNEAIRLDPTSTSVYSNRGNLWYHKREYDKAIADYNEASRLDQKFASPYFNVGVAWYDKKEYDKAIADYNEAIRLDPKDAIAYSNRGCAWCYKKEYAKAIADFSEAIRLDPKYAIAYDNRGESWRYKTEYNKAIADHNESVRFRSPIRRSL
jgi:tetratricopeptide (TPR) repeat protein